MSLILEALRKLDRDKQVPERGFLVMAPAAWPAQDERRKRWIGLSLMLVAAVIVGAALLQGTRQRLATPAEPSTLRPFDPPTSLAEVVHRTPQSVIDPPPLSPPHVGGGEASTESRVAGPSTVRPVDPSTSVAEVVGREGSASDRSRTASAEPSTLRPLDPSTSVPALVLQAITEKDGRPVALINDRLLREGDEIEGARLVKIGDAFVEIEYQGRRSALRF